MKKRYLTVLPIFVFSFLTACTNNQSSEIIISEYISGDNYNKVIEIYNDGNKDINLKDYYIGIYSPKDDLGSPSVKIDLQGTISSKRAFVISNSDADNEILSKTNQTSKDLMFGGKEGISLMHKNQDLDVIGALGVRNNNGNIAFVRKTWQNKPSTTFNNVKDYLYYNATDAIKYLGEFKNSVSLEDLLAGPKFVNDYLNTDFYEYTTSYFGTGGAVEVTLKENIDGDTSYFNFPTEAHIEKYMSSTSYYYNSSAKAYCGKVRYQEVDTPETQIQNNKVEEFGWPAKLNTAKLQNEAEHIYVQSNAGESMIENYGRMLGFVFVTNGNDSTLVNFDTIKRGYSTASLVFNGNIKYLDCPYYNYFVEAKAYAEENKLGLNGEKDPYWDYVNNKSKQL